MLSEDDDVNSDSAEDVDDDSELADDVDDVGGVALLQPMEIVQINTIDISITIFCFKIFPPFIFFLLLSESKAPSNIQGLVSM